MNEAWPWMALLGLGAFHGINPGMGWLFAVALGLQEQRRSVCALLVGAFLVILLLKVLLDVAEFVLRAVLAAVILIFHHPALGIAFACANRVRNPDRKMGRGNEQDPQCESGWPPFPGNGVCSGP